jgi:N-glycosylase/DNA lyase
MMLSFLVLDPPRSQGATTADEVRIVVAGVDRVFRWGRIDELGTAAFWTDQARRDPAWSASPRLGRTLREEIGACVLGGHGMPADVCVAAFRRLRAAGVFEAGWGGSRRDLEGLLSAPLIVPGRRRATRYRFWRQRADRLAGCLAAVSSVEGESDALALRGALQQLPGVGPKTASWIVRNHLGSNEVAVIDIHVLRAGLRAGFFDPSWQLPRHYRHFEEAFIGVANHGGVPTSTLDACIWGVSSWLGRDAHIILGDPSPNADREGRPPNGPPAAPGRF